ncbi:MAG: hypothetical protein ACYS0G_09785 [Planctomycetota bacterium]|jgi:hypothetical protein
MRRSNFVIGFALSAVLHGGLLVVVIRSGRAAPPPAPPPAATPIQIVSVDPDDKLPLDPLPRGPVRPAPLPLDPVPSDPAPPRAEPLPLPVAEPEPALSEKELEPEPLEAEPSPKPLAAAPAPPPPSVEPALESFVDATSVGTDGRRPGDGDAEYVPPLRVHWKDAAELVSVARTLGMRLAAVDRHGNIVAEIDLSETPGLKIWRGLPYGYSNRVRMLSPSIFSSRLGDQGGADIREIWVFVPTDRDRAMIEAQKAAVRRAGARPEDVLYVDGRFVRAANGSFRLDINDIRRRATGSRGDG